MAGQIGHKVILEGRYIFEKRLEHMRDIHETSWKALIKQHCVKRSNTLILKLDSTFPLSFGVPLTIMDKKLDLMHSVRMFSPIVDNSALQ